MTADEKVRPVFTVALAGNPNVGKSTVFNALTGMHQHTGNWAGKTVSGARGEFSTAKADYVLVDLPGTYSLLAHSAEEEVARDFICFGGADAAVAVCDATCLERNLDLVLQIREITPSLVVCVNLMDEAKSRGINIDTAELSRRLGVPVVGVTAHKKKTLRSLCDALDTLLTGKGRSHTDNFNDQGGTAENCSVVPAQIRDAAGEISGFFRSDVIPSPDWLARRLLEGDESLTRSIKENFPDSFADGRLEKICVESRKKLADLGIGRSELEDASATAHLRTASSLASAVVGTQDDDKCGRDRKIDRILTGKVTAFPVMLLLLALIFWLSVEGANYPSELLSRGFGWICGVLGNMFDRLGAPLWLRGVVVDGAVRVLGWVISVMLPPMAIFFPLFTLLEDSGYLPRIAYNLDRPFCCCRACGKQALTMCMGLGCNAVGVTGCRIIDSERERKLAVLTNSFMPCNGRFPTMIALVGIFFAGGSTVIPVLSLVAVIVVGVGFTLLSTKILSSTLLRGEPSSFTLELPPYRKPQIGRVIVRSVLDRTLFVLGRAAAVAAPAGVIIWIAANVTLGNGLTVLAAVSDFLDPAARIFGIDGVILTAFILGLPANEIVLPIILMAYSCGGSLVEMGELAGMRTLLEANGWTGVTAICVILFSLMHWPCSTTLLTVKKETDSRKMMLLAAVIPTAAGLAACFLVNAAANLFGI